MMRFVHFNNWHNELFQVNLFLCLLTSNTNAIRIQRNRTEAVLLQYNDNNNVNQMLVEMLGP